MRVCDWCHTGREHFVRRLFDLIFAIKRFAIAREDDNVEEGVDSTQDEPVLPPEFEGYATNDRGPSSKS